MAANSDLAGLREQIMDNVKVLFPFYYESALGSKGGVQFSILVGYKIPHYNAVIVWGADSKEFIQGDQGHSPDAALYNLLHRTCELISTMRNDKCREPELEVQSISDLPRGRKIVADTLSECLLEDFGPRIQSGILSTANGQTAKNLADRHALRIEHALRRAHGGPQMKEHIQQHALLLHYIPKNKIMVARFLDGELTAEKLSTMSEDDMRSYGS